MPVPVRRAFSKQFANNVARKCTAYSLLSAYSLLTTHYSLLTAYCFSSLIAQRLPHRRGHFSSQQFNRTQYLIMGHGAKTHLRQETRMSKEFVFI